MCRKCFITARGKMWDFGTGVGLFWLYVYQPIPGKYHDESRALWFLLLLLLFVFNIYVLAVVINVISSVRQVMINDQSLTKYSHLYISYTSVSILAVPNKAVFCITPTLHITPSFPFHLSNSAETPPRAPIKYHN